MPQHVDIANEIARQMGGAGRLKVTINAREFGAVTDEMGGLQFKFGSARRADAKNGANMVKVILTPADLYRVEFGYARGLNYTHVSTHDDVYCEDLVKLFEDETGWFIKIF